VIGRRQFAARLAAAAGAAAIGWRPSSGSAESPPETTTLRLYRPPATQPGACIAPQFVAEELLKAEGFTDVRYAVMPTGRLGAAHALAAGDIDFNIGFVGTAIAQVDAGDPIAVVAPIHVDCYELFAADRIRSVRDLKGKSIGVTAPGSGSHLFLLSLLSYIGLDPNKDVTVVTKPREEAVSLFAAGKLDAYQAFADEVPELRGRKIGHVLMSSTTERPWSLHFCCVLSGNREFVRKHPVATKRVVRAMLKASAVCALEPERSARLMVDRGFVGAPYGIVLDTIKSLPYTKWRDYDPDDTMRFYAVRLREVGMIKSTPQKLLAQGTDWRFLNELKKELKG